MQYLLQKTGLGSYSFATFGAQAEAYSPFAKVMPAFIFSTLTIFKIKGANFFQIE